MRQLLLLFLASSLFLLHGCADSSTTGTDKDVKTDIAITVTGNQGLVNINPGTDFRADAGDTSQDTRNSADVSPKTTANAGWNGGAASGQLDAAGAFTELVGDYLKDWSRADSDNIKERREVAAGSPIVEATPSTIGNINQDTGKTTVEVVTAPGEYSNVEGYTLKPAGNGRNFQWCNHNGAYYGDNVKIVFDNGESFIVRKGSVSSDQNGGGNMGLMWWFSGNDFEPGTGEHNPSQYEKGKGRASVFSAAGSSAKSVKIYFNR